MKDLKRQAQTALGGIGLGSIVKGSMVIEERRGRDGQAYEVFAYRYFDHQLKSNGRRKRLKVIVGRTDEMTEKQAWLKVKPLLLSANAERPLAISISMRELIARYVEEVLKPCLLPVGGVQSKVARMSHSCAAAYKNELIHWIEPTWGAYDVREFERPAIRTRVEDWLPSLAESEDNPNGRAPGSIRHVYNAMRQLFKRGVKWGYLNFNPLADDLVELPRGISMEVDKAEQVTPLGFFQMVGNLDVLPQVGVAVDGWLGTRSSEAFGLKWQDLNLKDAVVKFRQGYVAGRITPLKNKNSRTEMPIPPVVVELLREWRKITPYNRPEDWVFASPYTNGKRPYDPQTMMKKHIRPVALKLGLAEISWHSFRHSASRWAKGALKKLEDAKELLRQSDIRTTSNIYGGMPLEDKREVQRLYVRYIERKAKSEGWTGSTVSTTKKHTRKQSVRKENRAS
jgi:integrase